MASYPQENHRISKIIQPSYPLNFPPPSYPVGSEHPPPPPSSGVTAYPPYPIPGQSNLPSPPPLIYSYPISSATGFDQNSWMPAPAIGGCSPGLEYLTQIDQFLIHQTVGSLENVSDSKSNNKYFIKNKWGQKIYTASEENDCCLKCCCGSSRHFNMKIFNFQDQEIMHLYRPLRCKSCWFPCCPQRLEVIASGQLCGYVEQSWSLCVPKFRICNAEGETILRLKGSYSTCSCCGEVEFQVLSRDGDTQVGRINNQWTELAKELFTDADHFGISFPMDLDVNIKAVLLGACFLIDLMYFENSSNSKRGN